MPTLAAQITIGDYAKWRPVSTNTNHFATKLVSPMYGSIVMLIIRRS
jgi:hypothetical protein